MGNHSIRYLEMSGVKWELTEKPGDTDRLNTQIKSTGTVNIESEKSNIVPAVAPVAPESAVDAAQGADTLQSLLENLSKFEHPLKVFSKQFIKPHFSNNNSKLLVITDSPGAEDEQSGKILTGRAGDMFDKMMSAIGISRDEISILPLIFWRTPGGRTPTKEEIDLARPFVMKFISLINPSFILTLGTLSAQEIGGLKLPTDHGKLIEIDNNINLIPIYHPNFLILKPESKKNVWSALQILEKMLKNTEK